MDPQHNDQGSIKLTQMIQETVQMIHPFSAIHNVELQFLSTAENDLTLRDYSLLTVCPIKPY